MPRPIRSMSGSQFNVPLVIRMATGGGRQLAAQHSHSLEGWYAHIPGHQVLTPATLEDARGMLWTALEDPDPVLIFENVDALQHERRACRRRRRRRYRQGRGSAGGRDICSSPMAARCSRRSMLRRFLPRKESRRKSIDLRTPAAARRCYDLRLGAQDAGAPSSSTKAGAAAALPPKSARGSSSRPSSISTRPFARVCSEEVPIPYPRHLEEAAIPQTAKIVAAAKRVLGREG